MKMVYFVIIILIYVGLNIYVWSRATRMLPDSTWIKVLIGVVMLIGTLAFFVYMLANNINSYWLAKTTLFISTTWLTAFLYLLIAFAFMHIVGAIFRICGSSSSGNIANYLQSNIFVFAFIIAFISLMLVAGYMKYLWKKEVYVTIPLQKKLNYTGQHGDTLRVVGLSDLHLGYSIGNKELLQWVKQVNGLNPDMIVIAGDILDISVNPVRRESMQQALKQLNAPLGVYASLGNHEYLAGVEQAKEFFHEADIHLLQDTNVQIDSLLYVVGRDDKTNIHRQTLAHVLHEVDKTKPIILLDHQPDALNEAVEQGVDLQLSGHTHEGQVWPISLLTHLLFENAHGLLKKGDTYVYTSSGIGIWGGKFRIGTQSEIVIFDLVGKQDEKNNRK